MTLYSEHSTFWGPRFRPRSIQPQRSDGGKAARVSQTPFGHHEGYNACANTWAGNTVLAPTLSFLSFFPLLPLFLTGRKLRDKFQRAPTTREKRAYIYSVVLPPSLLSNLRGARWQWNLRRRHGVHAASRCTREQGAQLAARPECPHQSRDLGGCNYKVPMQGSSIGGTGVRTPR